MKKFYEVEFKFYKLKRAISAFKMAYNNEDFDWHYILEILNWKLKRVRDYTNLGYYVGYERDVKDLNTCINLITEIMEMDSGILATEDLNKKIKKLFKLITNRLQYWWT